MQVKANKVREIQGLLKEVDANRGVADGVDACVIVKRDKEIQVLHSNEKLQSTYQVHAATYARLMCTERSAVPTSAPARIVGSGAAIRDEVVTPPSAG